MGKNISVIEVGVNAPFDLDGYNNNISEKDKKALKNTGANSSLYTSDLFDESRFDIATFNPSLNKRVFVSDSPELIYQIIKTNDTYKVSTGKYIGSLIINNKLNLKITTGYNNSFLRRLLDFSNNIYFDNSASGFENKEDDFLLNIIQYMFLTSLRKSLVNGFPMEYRIEHDQGFNIKGNVTINKYVLAPFEKYKGIPYSFKTRKINTDILCTILTAFSCCDEGYVSRNFPDLKIKLASVKGELGSMTFNERMIKKAKSSFLLNSSLYTSYRKTLAYAEMLIMNNGYEPSSKTNNNQIHGWLVDVADLWELYLYKLIKMSFPDWDIIYQEEIPAYKGLFFRRAFMPDIVMKKDKDVVILDAKFKKMDFNNSDVDRNDLQQIHTYIMYYIANGFNVKFASLIYPARNEPCNKELASPIFESDDTSVGKFGISYMLVGKDNNQQREYETKFIERLRKQIGGSN